MTDRWEYASITWVYSTTNQTTNLPRTWKGEFSINRPDRDPETRLSHDSTNEQAKTIGIEALLNELGTEGWEVASETVMDTTVVSASHGWSEGGIPVQMRWLLKRQA